MTAENGVDGPAPAQGPDPRDQRLFPLIGAEQLEAIAARARTCEYAVGGEPTLAACGATEPAAPW